MKTTGILNRELAAILARIGHTDKIVIADCGLPIPDEVTCIDLSVSLGTPSLLTVFEMIMHHMTIESLTMASEIQEKNQRLEQHIRQQYNQIPVNYLTHNELKEQLTTVKVVIRTGEATPFANVILHAGVIF